MDLVKPNKEIINYNAVSAILDKISNWPKSPQLAEISKKSNKSFYTGLIFLSIGLVTSLLFDPIKAQIIISLTSGITMVYYSISTILDSYRQCKIAGFNIFKNRLSLMKNNIQRELEFILWLQKFHVIDRKFACERMLANHHKHIQLNNLLFGEKTFHLGIFSTASACAISVAVTVFKIDIDSSFLIIIEILCWIIGIIYLTAFIDRHINNKLGYFIALIDKSISLEYEEIITRTATSYVSCPELHGALLNKYKKLSN